MKTYQPSASDITREWFIVDAEDAILGRLATRVAHVLRGKHKPTFVPYMDGGDHVIVINAAKVRMSSDKDTKKVYHRHSGYPGGLTSVPFATLLSKSPEQVLEKAIKGMLPKNKLGRQMGTKLKVYAGSEHPHAAQQPKPLTY